MKKVFSLVVSGFHHAGHKICAKSDHVTILGSCLQGLTEMKAVKDTRMVSRSISTSIQHFQPKQQQHQQRVELDTTALELRGIHDRYRGVHVSLDQLPSSCSPTHFAHLLNASLDSWSQTDRSSVWMSVPIEKSHLIPEAAKLGFRFHHAENNHSVLCLWLRKDIPSLLPPFATHQVGVAGCIVNKETNQVLVVKDKIQTHKLWKFPGGLADHNEDIDNTAKREVWEETGLKTNFLGVLAFRQQHQHPDAYGRSDLFYVCLLTPITFDLRPCKEEIEICRWMTIDNLIERNTVSAISKRCLQLVRYGLKNGFGNVTIGVEECRSLYKGKRMKLFTRNVADLDENFDLGDYPHDVTTGNQF